MHFVYCIWIYKTQLPIHTPTTNYRNRNNPIYNCIKKIKYLEISLSKVLKYLCMKTFKTHMKEIFKRHKRKHILYLLTGRINIVNTSILPKAIYIFTAVSQNSKVFFTKQKKNSTTCIKLLFCSVDKSCLTLCDPMTAALQLSLSLTIS